MTADAGQSHDAQTTPVGMRTNCPQCGVQLDSFTTTCGACGAVVTGGTMDAERAERVRARLQQGIGAGYKLGDMLGRGGMGIVFQARELALDRDVALKVLAFDPLLNPDAYARFEREAKLAARLDHPNIVPIFSVGQGNGIAFYTMRMVRGGSVEGLVAGGRALDVGEALPILRDVAAALDYAHAQGVVHRDIKPANVLLGDSGHALVADFGIARAFAGPASSGATATGTGVVGSPAYMSPEQWRGEKVDGRADQYALGVLAFELLAGQRPFAGDSMQELLRMHLQEDAPDIISVRHDLPSHLTDSIRRAMSKDPAARFESSAAFVAALGGAAQATSTPRVVPVPGSSAPTIRTPQPGAAPAKTAARSPAPVRQAPAPDPFPSAGAVADRDGERRSLVPWLVLLLIATAGAAVIWKLAPGRGASDAAPLANASVAAPAGSVNLDSIAEIERALQAQVTEARRVAMEAERRADQLAAASRRSGAPAAAAPRELAHAHLYVFAQGGTPQVVIDGTGRNEAAPAVFQMVPGRHTVSVRGNQQFFPRDTTVELAAEDTQTVVFRSFRFAKQNGQVRQLPPAGAGATNGGAGNDAVGSAPTGVPPINWPDVVRKLGFDPRTVDLRRLTPEQKQRYRRFQQAMDSVRRASPRRP
jgi:serine/threonine protein kinase